MKIELVNMTSKAGYLLSNIHVLSKKSYFFKEMQQHIYIFLWNELCNSRMQIAKEKKTKAIKTRIESVDYLQLQSKYVHFKDVMYISLQKYVQLHSITLHSTFEMRS